MVPETKSHQHPTGIAAMMHASAGVRFRRRLEERRRALGYTQRALAASPPLTCTNAIEAGAISTLSSPPAARATARPPRSGSTASLLVGSTLYCKVAPFSATRAALVPAGPVRCHSMRRVLLPSRLPRPTVAAAPASVLSSRTVSARRVFAVQCAYARTFRPSAGASLATLSTNLPISMLQSTPP